ncbi:MAG: MlaD family protein [Chitinophagales bacterium]|nr:MlaD family protein [Chitinophagales bacterium]
MKNEVKIGALTLITIVILVLGYRYLKGEDIFTKTQTVKVAYSDVLGLYEANPVYYKGLLIGKISTIELGSGVDSLPVLLELSLDDDVKIPEDSKFEIVSLDLFGKKGISFEPGKSSQLVGDKIIRGSVKSDLLASVAQTLSPITAKAEVLVSSLDTLVNNLNAALGKGDKNYLGMSLKSLSTALESVNGLTANVNGLVNAEKGNIDAVMGNAKKLTGNLNTLTEKLNANTGKIESILANFDTLSGKINQVDLEGTIGEVKKTLGELSGIVEQINNGNGTISKLIKEDGVYKDIDKAIKSLDALLVDLKANPKDYVSISLIERKERKPKTPVTEQPVPKSSE